MFKKVNNNKFGIIEYTIDNENDLLELPREDTNNTVYAILKKNEKKLVYLYSKELKDYILINGDLEEINSEIKNINEQLEQNASKLNYNIISVPKFDNIENKFILGEKISADSRILNFDSLITNYYDSLLNSNSTYVSKSTLGLDSSGKYNIYKYTFKPNSPRYKVLLLSGVHGAENVYPHTLFNFFEFLCNTENLYDYPYFQEIYENFEFVVIPILNPHGWNGNYRTNGNNVDINRNFDYNWELNAS